MTSCINSDTFIRDERSGRCKKTSMIFFSN